MNHWSAVSQVSPAEVEVTRKSWDVSGDGGFAGREVLVDVVWRKRFGVAGKFRPPLVWF